MDEETAVVSDDESLIESAQPGEQDDASPETDDQQSEGATPEELEIEIDGVMQKVPAHLKDAVLRHADYTKKTQEIAERERELADLRQRAQIEEQLFQKQRASVELLAQERAIEARIKQYDNADWTAWVKQDPVAAQAAFMELSQLKDAKQQIAQQRELQTRQAEYQQQAHLAALREQGEKQLKKAIPNWGPAVAREIAEHARRQGYSDSQIQNIYDPKLVKSLYAEMQYEKAQRKAQPTVKPAAQVRTGGASGQVDPDKLTPDEWIKWREKQIRARR